mmetsp:Transcript_64333/g.134230  ORF Transcript_64333/g.134230 Transcript_64333/m.134230 type:complete len:126 (-) Transcript_64333:381-758(-)
MPCPICEVPSLLLLLFLCYKIRSFPLFPPPPPVTANSNPLPGPPLPLAANFTSSPPLLAENSIPPPPLLLHHMPALFPLLQIAPAATLNVTSATCSSPCSCAKATGSKWHRSDGAAAAAMLCVCL